MFLSPKTLKILGNCFMPICLPQQCLALVYGLPPPGDPLFRESPGWWVRLQSVGHRHRTCSHVFVPENFENFRKLFYAYMSTPAMPGPCVWAPTPWRSLVQGESRVVGQAAECRPQTQNVFPCFVPENFENFRKLFYAYMSTPAMPGPCVWAPTPWRSLVQGESRVVGQAAECRPQTQNVFPCFCARKL